MVSMVMPLMELLVTARNVHVRIHEQQREYMNYLNTTVLEQKIINRQGYAGTEVR